MPEVTQLVIVLLEYEPWKCGTLPALYEYAYYPTTSTTLGSDGGMHAGSVEMFKSGLHFQILARREGQVGEPEHGEFCLQCAQQTALLHILSQWRKRAIDWDSSHLPPPTMYTLLSSLQTRKDTGHMFCRGIRCVFCSRTWNCLVHSHSVLPTGHSL